MLNNDYIEVNLSAEAEIAEILTALIADFPFEMFEEYEGGTKAYIRARDYTEDIDNYLDELQDSMNFSYQKKTIVSENWNNEWEKNFHPLTIGTFCGIRADFHEPLQNVDYELVINPKMAFGTGHHETTHLAIEMMELLELKDKKVLDYGAGTGVLSILASKLLAKEIVAVDNEVPAYESTVENSEINDVHNVTSIYGTLDSVLENDFDIILANINRNVITNSLEAMNKKTKMNGLAVISGFLIVDHDIIVESIVKNGYQILEKKTRNDWFCMKIQKIA
jgi:ribosomal protein L11 methyltransferase